jgi:hypothetical protein
MKQLMKWGLSALVIVLFTGQAQAVDTGSRDFTLNGRLKQGFSAAYDIDGQDTTNGPANFLMEMKASYRPSRQWTFIADAWLRGDWAPHLDFVRSGALQDTTAPPFWGRQNFHLNRGRCAGTQADPYCASTDENRLLSDYDDVIREMSAKYRDKKNRYTVKVGKFQRGWGQSDGLRLLDVLHAQDLRERFAFRDSDELRIPAWMLSVDFNFKNMGIAGPFESIGMNRPVFEFNFVPEVHHSAFVINNPTNGLNSPTSGGLFGLPYPILGDKNPATQVLRNGVEWGSPGLGANLRDKEVDDPSFSRAEYSARLKFNSLGGQFTINGFYGYQDLPIVKFTGGNAVIGNAYNDEVAAVAAGGAVVPLNMLDGVAAINAPGGYMDWLRSIENFVGTGAAPIPFPLTATSTIPGPCADPVLGTAGVPCSLNANFDLDYTHRQKLLGFSFARDMSQFKFGPKNTSPSLRLEMGYEFNKPFNRSIVSDPFGGANLSGVSVPIEQYSTAVLIQDPGNNVTTSDVLSSMIGFDYPLWVPGWDSQQKSVFTSFQFFNIHTFDADDGLLQQAPYIFEEVSEDHQYLTFLWNAPVDNERLVFEGLYIRDFDNEGDFYRQRIDFNYFGNNWRPRIEWMHFSGNGGQNAPIGVLDQSDFIEASLTFQF